MAEWPEFSERHYELACNVELLGGGQQFFAPSTNAEQALGFDVAIALANPTNWAALPQIVTPVPGPRAPASPRAQAPQLPLNNPVFSVNSLFIQYKRPFHLQTVAAAEGPDRVQAGGPAAPFYRVTLPAMQHATLLALEASVQGNGLVRYAVPRFRSWVAMAAHQAATAVHSHSAWVEPSALMGSTVWTFDDPAAALHMHHSEAEPISGQDLSEVAASLGETAQSGDSSVVARYVADLATAVFEILPRVELGSVLREGFPDADEGSLAAAENVATIAVSARRAGLTWVPLLRVS